MDGGGEYVRRGSCDIRSCFNDLAHYQVLIPTSKCQLPTAYPNGHIELPYPSA